MGIYLNPGNQDFERVIKSGEYVDKSGLISYTNRVADSIKPYIASSRPRRFGKSLAVKLLSAYYSKGCDSRALFENLEISKNVSFEEHLNRYDVISLDIQEMRSAYLLDQSTDCKTPLDYIQDKVLREIKQSYSEYVSDDTSFIAEALAKINQATGNQFVVLIDEWDCFFREEKDNKQLLDAYIIFLRSMFKGIQADQYIRLAYITGILPIKKYGTQSALNHFDELTMIFPANIAPYIGFTEAEVRGLCTESGMPFSEMQKWYDGYQFIRSEWKDGRRIGTVEHVYCPNSVAEAIRKRNFGCYWTKTETYESLKSYIEMNFDGLKDKVVEMLAGLRCEVDVNSFQNDMKNFKSADDVLTLLIHLGYLAFDSERNEAFIPNLEVRGSFETAVKNNDWKEINEALRDSDELLELTWDMEEREVAERIEKVHKLVIPVKYYNNEQSLAAVIMLAYYSARKHYTIVRELESGRGFADVVLYPKTGSEVPAIVIELKWNKSAKSAIDQIRDKEYTDKLEQYRDNILLVGVNYDKKTGKHQCRIENDTTILNATDRR